MTSAHRLLDPKNDVAFKRIFGTEKNKDILIHFLNDMLVFKDKKLITDVTFLKPILDPEIFAKKQVSLMSFAKIKMEAPILSKCK